MILGIGSDLTDIRRMEQNLKRHGDRFTARVFTQIERDKSEGRANSAASYAKRFAAKEACLKALGTGLTQGITWQNIAVDNTDHGQPILTVSGKALERLNAMNIQDGDVRIHLTMTDDYPWAQAFVVIEAV